MFRSTRFKSSLRNHLKAHRAECLNGLLVFIAVFVLLVFVHHNFSLCVTEDCKTTRDFMKARLDRSVHPCEDFYNYSCGHYVEPLWPSLTSVKKRNAIKDNMLFGPERSDHANSTRTARKFYRDCLTSTPKNATAFEGLFFDQPTMYAELFGGRINWSEITMRARDRGLRYDYFLDVTTHFDFKSLRWYLKVKPPPSRNANIWTFDNYESIKMLMAFWRRNYALPSDKTINGLIEFGQKISKNDILKKIKKGLLPVRINDLAGISNAIHNWPEFLKRITNLPMITGETQIFVDKRILKYGQYLSKLEQLINENDYTIWFDYIAILTILDECWFLNIDAVAVCATFFNIDKKGFCHLKLTDGFERILEAEYIRTVVTNDTRSRVTDLAEQIRTELLKDIDKTTFSSPISRYAIQRNVQSLTIKVGAGDVVFDHAQFEKYYGIDISLLRDHDATKSYYRIMTIKADKKYKSAVARTRQAIWAYCDDPLREYPFTRGYYRKSFNAIYITLLGLELPTYGPDRPDYVNCAMLGKIIGREFIHAIFSPGPGYNLKVTDLASDPKHQKRLQCITDQYGAYLKSINVTMHDPWLHDFENLADVAAVNATTRVCQALSDKFYGHPLIMYDQLSPQRVMWLLGGMHRCEETSTISDDMASVHGIPYYRVVSGPMNSVAFGRDFRCRLGRKMSPIDKCQILGA